MFEDSTYLGTISPTGDSTPRKTQDALTNIKPDSCMWHTMLKHQKEMASWKLNTKCPKMLKRKSERPGPAITKLMLAVTKPVNVESSLAVLRRDQNLTGARIRRHSQGQTSGMQDMRKSACDPCMGPQLSARCWQLCG